MKNLGCGLSAEREAREILDTIPCVGPVTIDVVVSELGDVRRFSSQKKVVAYAGLDPGIRESANRSKQLGITKEESLALERERCMAWCFLQKSSEPSLVSQKWAPLTLGVGGALGQLWGCYSPKSAPTVQANSVSRPSDGSRRLSDCPKRVAEANQQETESDDKG